MTDHIDWVIHFDDYTLSQSIMDHTLFDLSPLITKNVTMKIRIYIFVHLLKHFSGKHFHFKDGKVRPQKLLR